MRFEECGDDCVDCEECKCICVCSPFFPAILKMYEFLVTLKFRTKVSPPGILIYQENPQWNGPLSSSKFTVIVEAALESAPQFVIQLYAMAVQLELVTIVQMVSLLLSFASLVWASTVAVEVLHSDGHFRVKDKVLIFSTHLFMAVKGLNPGVISKG